MKRTNLPGPSSSSRAGLNQKSQQRDNKNQKEQNEYFQTNALLISGLLPLISRAGMRFLEERVAARRWLKRLYTMNGSEKDRATRNDYVWFMLVQLENGTITLPFIKPPPEGRLRPVSNSVNKELYEKILEAANKKAPYLDNLSESKEIVGDKNKKKSLLMKPSEFQENQPTPRYGFFVYGSCFSNQND